MAHGQQDGLLVLGLDPVDQGGDLGAVPDEPGRVRRLVCADHLVDDQVQEHGGEQREGHADQEVELAAERPAVDEAPDPRLVRGHRASFNDRHGRF
ncbi:hypothetical protein SGLAM104S_07024 [Streptomyces glaucescens]